MKTLFLEGGPVFMGLLTIILLVLFAVGVFSFLNIQKGKESSRQLSYIKQIGLFGFVFGVFCQLVSLSQMFQAIQGIGDVSPSILAGGLKVSLITTEYGAIVFLIAYLLWFGLNAMKSKSNVD